jgi:arylformamidase
VIDPGGPGAPAGRGRAARRDGGADDPAGGLDPSWRGWPLERLEREYSPSSCVPAIGPFIDAYRSRSARAHATLPHVRLPYGEPAQEGVDLFPAGAGAPLLVFVHGGYWQELSARDSAFGAGQCVPHGIAWAAVDYTLAPQASLARIVDQCRRAVGTVLAHAGEFGCDPDRVWLAGSSAGAHLAALAMDGAPAPRARRPAGAILLSGIYDLRPLVPTYVNRALGLDEARAWALSPLAAPPPGRWPALVAWGENETASFVAQSRAYARSLGDRAGTLQAPGRNHFDLVFELGDPATPLGAAVAARLAAG